MSLRDVERTLKVFGWMYNQTEIFDAMDDVELEEQDDEEDMIQPAASVNILEHHLLATNGRLKHSEKTLPYIFNEALLLMLGIIIRFPLKVLVDDNKN